jgi:hypothetical protein
MSNKKVSAAEWRARELNTLICNMGWQLSVLVPMQDPDCGDMLWSLDAYDLKTGQLKGNFYTYAHERSVMRAINRLCFRDCIKEV